MPFFLYKSFFYETEGSVGRKLSKRKRFRETGEFTVMQPGLYTVHCTVSYQIISEGGAGRLVKEKVNIGIGWGVTSQK